MMISEILKNIPWYAYLILYIAKAKPKVVVRDRDEDDNGGNHYQISK